VWVFGTPNRVRFHLVRLPAQVAPPVTDSPMALSARYNAHRVDWPVGSFERCLGVGEYPFGNDPSLTGPERRGTQRLQGILALGLVGGDGH